MKLDEFDQIGRIVTENLSPDAQVIMGARIDKNFTGKVRVITIMTGVHSPYVLGKNLEEHSMPASKEISDLGIEVWS
jgi:cell division protein FtsZ